MKNGKLVITVAIISVLLSSGAGIALIGTTNALDLPQERGGIVISVSDEWELIFSTYLGGLYGEYNVDVEIDSSGNVYALVSTTGNELPTTYNLTTPDDSSNYVILAKFYPNGTAAYVICLALGTPYSMALDSSGDPYICGSTTVSGFPTTSGAYQEVKSGQYRDGFIMHLDGEDGTIIESTLFGGDTIISDIYLDSSDNVYATGRTEDPIPTSPSAYMSTINGTLNGFAVKFNSDLSSFLGGTLWGGMYFDHGHSICVDGTGNIYVGGVSRVSGAYMEGDDAYIVKFNPTFTSLMWDDRIGASGENIERFNDIAIDPAGYVVAVGLTNTDGLAENPAFNSSLDGGSDCLVVEYSLFGTRTMVSYLGGSSHELLEDVDIKDGYRYFIGYSQSDDFPILNSYSDELNNAQEIVFLKTDSDFNLIYSSNIGGSSSDTGKSIAVGADGSIAIGGSTLGYGFPLLNAYQSEHGMDSLPYEDACVLLLTEPELDETTPTTTTDTTTGTGTTDEGSVLLPQSLEVLSLIITIGSVTVILVVGALIIRKR